MFRRWWVLLAGVAGIVGVGLAWGPAHPDGPDPSSIIRVLADCLGATMLGLALLRTDLFPARGRPPVWRMAALVGGLWTVAEGALIVVGAAESVGASVGGVSVAAFGTYLTEITVGQLGVVTVVCTGAACLYALAAYRADADRSSLPVAAGAVIALVARPITGHMSQQTFGALLVSVHTLAAAVWLGVLAALAMTLRARGAWASMLPVYSRIAWWCVVVLTVSGVVNAAVKLGSLDALFDTGYGRVVVAKTVALVILVFLARRIRAGWLVSVAAHRTRADESTIRAATHVCVLTVAFGLAAALATTA